jgi:hypothetical protein
MSGNYGLVNCPGVAEPAVRTETADGCGNIVIFRRSYIAKVLFVKCFIKRSFLFLSVVPCFVTCLSWLQCAHTAQCHPKGQPDWNYFNSFLLWTWCRVMPTVIGAAWIFMGSMSINGGHWGPCWFSPSSPEQLPLFGKGSLIAHVPLSPRLLLLLTPVLTLVDADYLKSSPF